MCSLARYSNVCPEEEGIKTQGRDRFPPRAGIQTSALKKKGLRHLFERGDGSKSYSNVCPEEEGIKTRVVYLLSDPVAFKRLP